MMRRLDRALSPASSMGPGKDFMVAKTSKFCGKKVRVQKQVGVVPKCMACRTENWHRLSLSLSPANEGDVLISSTLHTSRSDV